VLRRIRVLAENGLTLMMVLFDFLSKRIAPLQLRARPAWIYTEENDAMRLERGSGPDLDPTVLARMLQKLSFDPSSDDFINPSARCMPLCLDQATRLLLLKELPTLDYIDIAVRQTGDQSRDVHIAGTCAAGTWRTDDVASSLGKGKEKVVSFGSASKARSWTASSDTKTSSEEAAPLERKRRLARRVRRWQIYCNS
jgi:hypothetical protein